MGWLRQIASKLVQDPTLADDLAQQAWLAAQREPRAWRTQGDLRAWLTRVVQNMARSTARRDRRRKELEAYASGESRHAPATDELVARAQLQAELARTVLELDEPHKSAILLRFLDGLTHEEMSARLGVST
jgi:RNA polymerase sigma-70 factor (ECF subfamily)